MHIEREWAMRMLWGGVSLLLVMAIVGWLVKMQLRPAPAAVLQGAPEAASAVALVPATPVQDLPRKVQDDLTRAMQSAPARDDDAR